jgi:SAM-dependent methyltransferase
MNYLLTGKAGALTNVEARLLDRYLARAVNGVLTADLPDTIPGERRRRIEALRWHEHTLGALRELGATVCEGVSANAIPLPTESVDLCHSGGTLEHYRPEELAAFLSECFRILRAGGVASHVFDHRDHLYHADRCWPFLAHLALPDPLYSPLCGHALSYHNRLLPAQVMHLFEAAGFEKIVVRRLILPDRRYVEGEEALAGQPGIHRSLLARRFRKLSEVDRRTAAAHYLYRKPGRKKTVYRPAAANSLPFSTATSA